MLDIINPGYKKQLQAMHENPKLFVHGARNLEKIDPFLLKYRPSTLIDFGCSHGALINAISEKHQNILCAGYDPGVPKYENIPTTQFDVLVSTDVLEHIEYEYIDQTLQLVSSLFTNAAYLLIASYPAKKTLPDGRNAHLIIEEFDWWQEKIKTHITGTIITAVSEPFRAQPKKGPEIVGNEFVFVITK